MVYAGGRRVRKFKETFEIVKRDGGSNSLTPNSEFRIRFALELVVSAAETAKRTRIVLLRTVAASYGLAFSCQGILGGAPSGR